ncbi:ImmA/IrrE family metallo-endopeptidase [Frankia sp. AgPm24]|uniref:ImmA/IrrE family metallo-endopeptidase n=1 Tax=Frankia sp. AgPm24 TaxID=631128 RepID=UPI00200BFD6A|nr:ImmA/IrrE family metallo-endopeptidase [Frankia sp. AgPm24]
MRARPLFADAPRQAEAILRVVEERHPGSLAALCADPLATISSWPDVQVTVVPESGDGDGCSVSGSYLDHTQPPTLRVAASRSRRRRGFTVLHELGHHLQQTDPELGQRVFTRVDSENFEEAACDAFAARVLLPDGWVRDRVDLRGPTATEIVDMFQNSQASREACCVRASELLSGGGIVVLLDATGRVVFASPRGVVPPARGSDQSDTPLIRAALRGVATVEHDDTFVTYRNGARSDPLYGQAAWCDKQYMIAVLAPDNVGWRRFAPPRSASAASPAERGWICEICPDADPFEVFGPPCQRCGQPKCENGHCGCTPAGARAEQRCDRCFLVLAATQFDPGRSICRSCAE